MKSPACSVCLAHGPEVVHSALSLIWIYIIFIKVIQPPGGGGGGTLELLVYSAVGTVIIMPSMSPPSSGTGASLVVGAGVCGSAHHPAGNPRLQSVAPPPRGRPWPCGSSGSAPYRWGPACTPLSPLVPCQGAGEQKDTLRGPTHFFPKLLLLFFGK